MTDPTHHDPPVQQVELTIHELDHIIAALDHWHQSPHSVALSTHSWKQARGKLLFAHRKAWLDQQGLPEQPSETDLDRLRESLITGGSWTPPRLSR